MVAPSGWCSRNAVTAVAISRAVNAPPPPHARRRGARFGEALHPAQPAAGRADDRAATAGERVPARRDEPEAEFDAVGVGVRFEAEHFVGARDYAFGEAEAQREIVEIGWGGHHHRVRAAVIDDRDRHFFGDDALANGRLPAPPRGTADG